MDDWNKKNQNEQNDTTQQGNNNEQLSNNSNDIDNYVFLAEGGNNMPETSNNERTPQYEAATYSLKKEEINQENKYKDYEQGPNNYGSFYAAGGGGGENPIQQKKTGKGKKTAKFIVCAAAFGLVAGVVFQGVNRVSNSLFPENTANTITNTTPTAATTVSTRNTVSSDLTDLVENTMPSIVSITSTVTQDYSYFGQVFQQEYDGSGSGIIIGQNDKELLIVTNNHVVDNAKAIAVNFINDEVYEATLKGKDSTADLAVVAVKLSDMSQATKDSIKIATLGNSDDVKVGQMAIAIGNALGSGQSVTVGYISAKNRQVNTSSDSKASQLELLQTDAAINPGNSGGALLNINGEVIGINDLKYSDTDVEGMGYAIPISEAIPIINDLMSREILNEEEKGYLGITGIVDITEDNNIYDFPIGVYVGNVYSGSGAEKGGLKKGDIIVKVNKAAADTVNTLKEKVNNLRAGTEITITVMRNDNGNYKEVDLTVKLVDKAFMDKAQPSQQQSSSDKKGNFGYKSGNGQDNETMPEDSGNTEQGQEDIFNFMNPFE